MKNPQKLSVTSHLLYQMNPAEITVWILCVRITFTYCTVGETCWLLFFIVISIAGYEGRVGMAAIVLKQGRTLHGPKLYDHLVETLPAFAWPWFLRIQVCHLLNHSLYFYISLLAHLFLFFFRRLWMWLRLLSSRRGSWSRKDLTQKSQRITCIS